MSDGDYGYCEYCGSYRPLRYSHKYCSKRCYIDSGQEERDIQADADREQIWYGSNSLRSHLFRIACCALLWIMAGIFALIVAAFFSDSLATDLVSLFLNAGLIPWAIVVLLVSLVQDILIAIILGHRLITNLIMYLPLGVALLLLVLAKMGM